LLKQQLLVQQEQLQLQLQWQHEQQLQQAAAAGVAATDAAIVVCSGQSADPSMSTPVRTHPEWLEMLSGAVYVQ
jgi:hypothetical protein